MSIDWEERGAVVVITINRPEARNALDPAHNAELRARFAAFDVADHLSVAVLTGAGEVAFSAGADLKRLIPPFRDRVLAGEEPEWTFGGMTSASTAVRKPVIAAVNGQCLAGGLELALACDIRIASPHAKFGLTETRWGLIPGAGGTQRLPRTVPLGLAMEMILSGDPIDAERALAVGLVNRIVPTGELLAAAVHLAGTIARRGPLAVRAAKEAVFVGLEGGMIAGFEREARLFLELMRTADAVEGPLAFAEKRPPRFTGR